LSKQIFGKINVRQEYDKIRVKKENYKERKYETENYWDGNP
jgi:hypothetical protein